MSDPHHSTASAVVNAPFVTMAILGFNQAQFIEEAINAAFAQDYSNLEILLSDDGSTDGTREIMEHRAADYSGPHMVRAIRTPRNGGLIHHVECVARAANGELVLLAAGDDVSLPHRTRTLVDHWRRERPAIIYSAWNRVDVNGRFLSRDGIADQHDRDFIAYFPDSAARAAAFGCTTAYATGFLRAVPAPAEPIWSEDYFLSMVAMLTGETIAYVDEALVSYRQNPAAQRNFATGQVDHRAYEEREARFFDGLAALLAAVLAMVDRGKPAARTRVNRAAIVRDIGWYRYRADWTRLGASERIRYTMKLTARDRLRWAIPRLLGLPTFLQVKTTMARWRARR